MHAQHTLELNESYTLKPCPLAKHITSEIIASQTAKNMKQQLIFRNLIVSAGFALFFDNVITFVTNNEFWVTDSNILLKNSLKKITAKNMSIG